MVGDVLAKFQRPLGQVLVGLGTGKDREKKAESDDDAILVPFKFTGLKVAIIPQSSNQDPSPGLICLFRVCKKSALVALHMLTRRRFVLKCPISVPRQHSKRAIGHLSCKRGKRGWRGRKEGGRDSGGVDGATKKDCRHGSLFLVAPGGFEPTTHGL